MMPGIINKISPRERFDLIIAWLVISIAFAIMFKNNYLVNGKIVIGMLGIIFLVSFLTAGIAFVLHELAHKFSAMKFGYYAEFRKDTYMLLMSVVLAALVGVVFAAPGATVIYAQHELSKREDGIISASGPAVNLLLCIPFFIILVAGSVIAGLGITGILLIMIGSMGLSINAMIAFFNLLPISILDGKKVFAWNPAIFALMIAASLLLILFSMDYYGMMTAVMNAIL